MNLYSQGVNFYENGVQKLEGKWALIDANRTIILHFISFSVLVAGNKYILRVNKVSVGIKR